MTVKKKLTKVTLSDIARIQTDIAILNTELLLGYSENINTEFEEKFMKGMLKRAKSMLKNIQEMHKVMQM